MRTTVSDPYDKLPEELFLGTLSFLGPRQISRSQRVCRSWRDFVLSNSSLHQVIYLNQRVVWGWEKRDHDSNLEKITVPLRRQAALSKDKLVDVSLELRNLRWEVQESGKSDLDEILSILIPSISTLQNLDISITEEGRRSEPISFGILKNKKICASLQHLQLDLDSTICRMNGKDSLSTLLGCGRLKTLKIKDEGPIGSGTQPDPLLSESLLFTTLRKHSEFLEILEIRNVVLEEDGSLETVQEWDQVSFPRLESLALVGLDPSLLSFLSLTKVPVLSQLSLSTERSAGWREEVELIQLDLLGRLLDSASDCLESISFELLDASGWFGAEIWLPKLEDLSVTGCYPAMREAMTRIKCPQLKRWTMVQIENMYEHDFSEEWMDPSDLSSFLQTANLTLEEIDIGELYFDPIYEEEDLPSRKWQKKHLPFPNLVSLCLTFFVEGYDKPVLRYFPRQKEVEERARLRKLEQEESEDE